MCQCASCEYTDRYAGLPELLGWKSHDGFKDWQSFKGWPRGDPAGKRSATIYAPHVAASKRNDGNKLPASYGTVPKGAVYPTWITAQLVMPVTPASPSVLAWINRPGQAKRGNVFPGPDVHCAGTRRRPGHPAILRGAKRTIMSLDAEAIERARRLGKGNLSAGIRLALAQATA